MKINVDGAEYRKIEGAMTWEVRSGPAWAYVQPIMADLLDALAVEREARDGYRKSHLYQFGCVDPATIAPVRVDGRCMRCKAHDARRAAETKESS